MNPIKDAISMIGSVTVFAHALGVTPQAVCFWRDGKRQIPADKCPLIERVTKGAVTCEMLRPDVDWNFIRGTAKAPVTIAQPATETVSTDADAIRTGAVRRRSMRMAKGFPVDGDRRSQVIPPLQAPVVGVA